MLTPEDAARLVLASAVRDAIADKVDEIRDELRTGLQPGDRKTAYVDGVNVGSVQMTQPKPATKVVDYGALMIWVLEHVPAAIVTTQTINQAWVTTLLKGDGTWTDPQTGEVLEVPGLGVSQAPPRLMVTQTDQATAWAIEALAVAMYTPLAIAPADEWPEGVTPAVEDVHLGGEATR